MLKDLEILVTLIFLFIGIFFIFNARGVVKKKVQKNNKDENKVVNIVKVIAYIVTVLSLGLMYILIK